MWLRARTSCLPVWPRPPSPSHRSCPQGMGGDKQALLPSSKGVLRKEHAGSPACRSPTAAARACSRFYGFPQCDNERKHAASAARLLHGCYASEIKGDARGVLGDAAVQAAVRPMARGIPRHAVPPTQHCE